MAQIATLTEPYLVTTFDFVAPLPYNKLTETFVVSSPLEGWVAPIVTNRFPTPPTAVAFLGVVDFDMQIDGLGPPYSIIGAVYPETKYLEPTVGQIWPR